MQRAVNYCAPETFWAIIGSKVLTVAMALAQSTHGTWEDR